LRETEGCGGGVLGGSGWWVGCLEVGRGGWKRDLERNKGEAGGRDSKIALEGGLKEEL